MENRSFPKYRKYAHERTYFKILSAEHFEELAIHGSFYSLRPFRAQIHPDRVLINDMIQNHNNHWLESNEKEYEEKVAYCKQKLKELKISE